MRRVLRIGGPLALVVLVLFLMIGSLRATSAGSPLAMAGAPVDAVCTLEGEAAPVAASSETLTAKDVAALALAAGFPAREIPTAVAVAHAESQINPRAINDKNTNGSTDYGLWQINTINASVLASGDWSDPADNAAMAFAIWSQWGNWEAWATFNSGSYEQYLDTGLTQAEGCTPKVVIEADCKGGASGDLSEFPNGQIPASALCPLWVDGNLLLRADAAASFNAMSKAYYQHFGTKPCVTDAYRDLATQKQLRIEKPTLAAAPGTSLHGWGIAVDLGCGANVPGTEADAWYEANSLRYGWDRPDWADPNGSKPENWHREYVAGAR